MTDLVGDHILDGLSRGFQVRAGVEGFGMFHQILADGGGHGQTDVGIHIDLAHAHAGSLAQHVFRHTAGAAHLAAELVAGFHEFLGHAGGAVQHQRDIDLIADLCQTFKIKFWNHSFWICSMCCSYCHCQTIAVCSLYELFCLFYICIQIHITVIGLCCLSYMSKLCLTGKSHSMCETCDLLCSSYILFEFIAG